MPTTTYPKTARKRHALSALAARRAAREAAKARPQGFAAVAGVVMTHQIFQAQTAEVAVQEMLIEQEIDQLAEAMLNSLAFTTAVDSLEAMIDSTDTDVEFERLVASLVQDAGRSAESVAITTRPNVGWVRMLTPPSCSRCAVLAGRVYRYSQGFLRHPGDDCVMIPTTVANDQLVQDPKELLEQGLIRGLSEADQQAIANGADFGQIVNVRSRTAGLSEAGRVLARAGRPTPEGIYRSTASREAAIEQLIRHGYLRG